MADFINIDQVLHRLNLKNTMSAAEFGSASAGFTLALAKKLANGKVYAIDIQEQKLSALKSKLVQEKLQNVYLVHGDVAAEGGSLLADNSLDVAVIPNVLFQAEDRYGIMKEASRTLAPGGQLAVVDWYKKSPFGPRENLLTWQEARAMGTQCDLVLKKQFAAGDYHFALMFVKHH